MHVELPSHAWMETPLCLSLHTLWMRQRQCGFAFGFVALLVQHPRHGYYCVTSQHYLAVVMAAICSQ